MILQALTEHYEALVSQGKLARPGWSDAKVTFALAINDSGELTQVLSLKTEQTRGKKTVPAPQSMSLPAPVKRTVGIAPNFLWDNSSYILGVDAKGKPQRSLDCFHACRTLHHRLLDGVDSPAAKALLAFFDRWEPDKAAQHPALNQDWDELIAGANLIFMYRGGYVQDDPLIRQAWQSHYDSAGDGPEMVCLVTGQKGPVEPIHPAVKGVAGAQSSGAALVSFNAPAFCSYGREQNLNAPVGKYAAFAYTAALNDLLADRAHTQRTGDTTVLFWAKSGQPAFQAAFSAWAFGSVSSYNAGDLAGMLADLLKGHPVQYDDTLLDPNMDFYILGLAPNAARLSVRFFLHNTFGAFLQNVQRHNERLEIVRPSFDKFEAIPLWKLLEATVNQKSNDKSPSPGMAGETLRAILTNTPYPATLLNGVTLRIRAECSPSAEDRKKPPYNEKTSPVTYIRAAILKAYYTKLAEARRRENPDIPKEVLTVSLNPNSTNVPYNLGRLFSVLEAIQSAANPGINATIKDKYFNSASATPSRVFPTLINLAQKHLRKLEKGQQIYYSKQLTELTDKFGEAYPDRLGLPQQGSFQLGYYHQTQARYQKKEEE